MADDKKIKLTLDLTGNLVAKLKEAAQAAGDLADKTKTAGKAAVDDEAKYAAALEKRIAAAERAKRLAEDMARIKSTGSTDVNGVTIMAPGLATTAHEQYKATLERRRAQMELNARLRRDLGPPTRSAEEKYQDELQRRLERRALNERLKADMNPPKPQKSDDEEYREILHKRLYNRFLNERLKRDMNGPPLTEEQTYQKALEERRKRLALNARLKADIEGPKPPPLTEEQKRAKRLSDAIRRKSEAAQLEQDLAAAGYGKTEKRAAPQAEGAAGTVGIDGLKAAVKRFAGPLAIATAGLMAFKGVVTQIGTVASIVNDPRLKEDQRSEKLAESIPVIGRVARAWNEMIRALDGTTATIIRNEQRLLETQARSQAQIQTDTTMIAFRVRVASAQNRASALSETRLPAGLSTVRTTLGEQIAYAENLRLQPLHDQRATLQAEASAAGTDEFQSRARHRQASMERDRLIGQRDFLVRRYDRASNRQDRSNLSTRIEELNQQIGRQQNRVLQEQARLEESVTLSVRARNALRQNELSISREQLASLERREQIARGNVRRVGGTSPYERQANLEALEYVNRVGIDAAGPEAAHFASQLAPEYIANLQERAGQDWIRRNPAFAARLQAAAPGEQFDVQGLERQVNDAREQVRQQGLANDRRLADELAGSLRGLTEELERNTQAQIREAVERVRNEVRRRNQDL